MDLSLSIFSYNRGDYLKNCIDSVRHCTKNAELSIFDDGSVDQNSIEYLQTLGDRVVHCGDKSAGRHGGLYGNMQRALDRADRKYILFLQDDTQLVRMVDQQDMDCIESFFDQNPKAAFINPVFLKGHRRRSIEKQVRLVPEFEGYFHDISETMKPRPVSMYYCDVVIAHVERLREIGWHFCESETANAELARTHFSKMLQMANPFVMHVPEVPVFRDKTTTFGSRLAIRLVGSDVKAFNYMSEPSVTAMRKRDLSEAPFAEDFLTTKNAKVAVPYRYNAVSSRLYTRVLHKIEDRFRHLLGRA